MKNHNLPNPSISLKYPHFATWFSVKIKEECVRTLELIPWVTKVEVDIFLKKPLGSTAAMGSSLRNVEHVIAVSSCKVPSCVTLEKKLQ